MPSNPWNAVQSEHEQDFENAKAWWADASEADKVRVWMAIQNMGGPKDPVKEIVSRMAQLGFETVALRMENDDAG